MKSILNSSFAFENISDSSLYLKLSCKNCNLAIISIHKQFENRLAMLNLKLASRIIFKFSLKDGIRRYKSRILMSKQ